MFQPSFTSEYGKTADWREPHEFSYFWRDSLGCNPHLEDQVRQSNVPQLGSSLIDLGRSAGTAIAVKAFPALWLADRLCELPSNVRFLIIEREADEIARSLRAGWMRAAETGEDWFSLRPKGWESIVGGEVEQKLEFQVAGLLGALQELKETVEGVMRWQTLSYRELVESPGSIPGRMSELLG